MSDESGGFFTRWSRRKAENAAPTGKPPVETDTPAAVREQGEATEAPQPPVPRAPTAATAPDAPPPPTLDDVVQLTHESDFSPYVGRAVAPEVRNAAMKKLFADPHFNVMDGLDIYIDDYSKPSPLPAELLKKMVSAQFMKLVEPELAPEPTLAPVVEHPPEPVSTADPQSALPPSADPDPDPDPETAPPTPTATAHDHLDLQLQPDHAPRSGGTGSGAG